VASAPDWRPRRASLWLVAIFLLSFAFRALLSSEVKSPFIFLDELVYPRLAVSIGHSASLSLWGTTGLTYPPLYPVVLSPIYALHASGTTAYVWIKIVNSFLMSLAVFPIYKIGRFVAPRRHALIVAGLAALAPLMYYTTLAMSENLAYPLCMLSVWAMLAAIQAPSAKRDAVLLVSIVAATGTRLQMVVLFPAALTAIAAVALLADRADGGAIRSIGRRFSRHRLLVAATVVALLAYLVAKATGHSLSSATGSYSTLGSSTAQSPWAVARISVQQLAELSLALGVVPFAGTLVAAYVFFRYGPRRGKPATFAAVALAVTFWMLVEVADAAVAIPSTELPRIHERYLIYVLPLFITAFLAAARLPAERLSVRVTVSATMVAVIAPALIPFGKVVNNTIVGDTFGLDLFARQTAHDKIVALHNPVTTAVIISAAFGSAFVLARHALPALVIGVAIFFLLFSLSVRSRIVSASLGAAKVLRVDGWVDQSHPKGRVALIIGPGMTREVALETAFYNTSVSRIYATCTIQTGTGLGYKITAGRDGSILENGDTVRAAYAVVSQRFRVRGTVIARDKRRKVLVVKTAPGPLRLVPGEHATTCPSS
jgi:hypothetical protein